MTKLCCLNQYKYPFLSFRAHAETLKLASFEPTGLAHLDYQGAMLKKYHKFINSSQSLRRLMSWKPPM